MPQTESSSFCKIFTPGNVKLLDKFCTILLAYLMLYILLNSISLCRFYCKNNGVLYENDTIQIGVKTECRANLARMALFYGNKTSFPFIVSA